MEQKRSSGFGFVLAAAAGVGAFLLLSGDSKAAAPPKPSDPCQPLIDRANKLLPTAKESDLPALRELATTAKTLGCTALESDVNKKISELTKKPAPPGPKPPSNKMAAIPSGAGPVEFAAKYGITIERLAALNPTLTWGVVHEDLSRRVADCGLHKPLLPATGGDSISGGPNPEYPGSIIWDPTYTVNAGDYMPIFQTVSTGPRAYRKSDGAGGIDCASSASGVGRIFSAAGATRFVAPWRTGLELLVPSVAVAGVAGEMDASVEGCIACELPNPKDKFVEAATEKAVAFGSMPFGGSGPSSYGN